MKRAIATLAMFAGAFALVDALQPQSSYDHRIETCITDTECEQAWLDVREQSDMQRWAICRDMLHSPTNIVDDVPEYGQ